MNFFFIKNLTDKYESFSFIMLCIIVLKSIFKEVALLKNIYHFYYFYNTRMCAYVCLRQKLFFNREKVLFSDFFIKLFENLSIFNRCAQNEGIYHLDTL